MKMKKQDLLKSLGLAISPEEIKARRMESYEKAKINLENMSYWLPKIKEALSNSKTSLKTPETLVIPLDFSQWEWLHSDNYKDEAVQAFNDSLLKQSKDFRNGKEKVFMKSGIFSNKFEFNLTEVFDENKIGRQFLDIFYTSMMLGANETAEVVLRDFISSSEDIPTIYGGMPLNTEYRVFYDFDKKEIIGIANYWHPTVMENGIRNDEDLEVYLAHKERLVNSFNQSKVAVSKLVHESVQEAQLSGAWSVDVMESNGEFWLIDMARMEKSALRNLYEEVKLD